MTEDSVTHPRRGDGLAPVPQWIILVGLSAGFAILLTWLGVPASLLLGPLLAGIAVTVGGGKVQLPRPAFSLAQGVIGCMIAKALPLSISGDVIGSWPLFAVGVTSVIAASGLVGWLMTRMHVLPGTTIVWGLSPGAATAMTLLAESYGADAKLVAFMQYTRVILVAAIASVIAKVCGAGALHAAHTVTWFPAVAWLPLAETLALAVLGPVVASQLGMPAGALLIPVVVGIFLVDGGWMTMELPPWLLAIGYAFVGWRIGLRFTRRLLIHAAKALPRIIASTLALIAVCGGLAALFVVTAGLDPLTAYLATSPGGADSVAIIAASSNVDVPFVMTMQMARFVVLLILGPTMARFISKHADAASDASGN
jgi:membrane AbrB-like protein